MGNSQTGFGTILGIPLEDGTYGYCQILHMPNVAFFDFHSPFLEKGLKEIAAKPVLFVISVQISTMRHWENLGKTNPIGDAAKPVVKFWQDQSDFRQCIIYDTDGMEKSASPEECVGLECAAVWEAKHVEERLLDRFLGKPNSNENHLRVRFSD